MAKSQQIIFSSNNLKRLNNINDLELNMRSFTDNITSLKETKCKYHTSQQKSSTTDKRHLKLSHSHIIIILTPNINIIVGRFNKILFYYEAFS